MQQKPLTGKGHSLRTLQCKSLRARSNPEVNPPFVGLGSYNGDRFYHDEIKLLEKCKGLFGQGTNLALLPHVTKTKTLRTERMIPEAFNLEQGLVQVQFPTRLTALATSLFN